MRINTRIEGAGGFPAEKHGRIPKAVGPIMGTLPAGEILHIADACTNTPGWRGGGPRWRWDYSGGA